jgi:hypothetical protein
LTAIGASALCLCGGSLIPVKTWFSPFFAVSEFWPSQGLVFSLGSRFCKQIFSSSRFFSLPDPRPAWSPRSSRRLLLSSVFCRLLLFHLRSLVLRSSISLSFAQHRSVSVVSPTRFLPPPIGSCYGVSRSFFPRSGLVPVWILILPPVSAFPVRFFFWRSRCCA